MLKKILALALAGFILLQTILFLSETWWIFELFVHYAHYYAVLGIALALLALKAHHHSFALLFVTFVSIHAATIAPYLEKNPPPEGTPTLTVLASNFYKSNTDFENLEAIVEEEQPDLFMIHEAGPQWSEGIEYFSDDYPYTMLSSEPGVHGIVLASKTPGSFREVPLGAEFGLEFIPEDGSYRVLGVHPPAPLTPSWAAERNTQFKDIIAYVNSSELPTLIMGDFNATPWSSYLVEVMEETGLRDARLGFGFISTWHAHNPFFKIPIDHALVSEGWEVLDFYRTSSVDSDHFPVVVKLR